MASSPHNSVPALPPSGHQRAPKLFCRPCLKWIFQGPNEMRAGAGQSLDHPECDGHGEGVSGTFGQMDCLWSATPHIHTHTHSPGLPLLNDTSLHKLPLRSTALCPAGIGGPLWMRLLAAPPVKIQHPTTSISGMKDTRAWPCPGLALAGCLNCTRRGPGVVLTTRSGVLACVWAGI